MLRFRRLALDAWDQHKDVPGMADGDLAQEQEPDRKYAGE
jgi:hypothetical protein